VASPHAAVAACLVADACRELWRAQKDLEDNLKAAKLQLEKAERNLQFTMDKVCFHFVCSAFGFPCSAVATGGS
jgi:hypothetical protein